jgi:hypothetical protein
LLQLSLLFLPKKRELKPDVSFDLRLCGLWSSSQPISEHWNDIQPQTTPNAKLWHYAFSVYIRLSRLLHNNHIFHVTMVSFDCIHENYGKGVLHEEGAVPWSVTWNQTHHPP